MIKTGHNQKHKCLFVKISGLRGNAFSKIIKKISNFDTKICTFDEDFSYKSILMSNLSYLNYKKSSGDTKSFNYLNSGTYQNSCTFSDFTKMSLLWVATVCNNITVIFNLIFRKNSKNSNRRLWACSNWMVDRISEYFVKMNLTVALFVNTVLSLVKFSGSLL